MVDNIIFICSGRLIRGNNAGSARVLNYSKAFSSLKKTVYISSLSLQRLSAKRSLKVLENIYEVNEPINYKNSLSKTILKNNYLITAIYLFKIARFVKRLEGKSCIILYPSVDPTMEPLCILILKKLFGFKIFIEINELRRSVLIDRNLPPNPIKRILGQIRIKTLYLQYKSNENLTKYFDGLIIISTNLVNYYRKFNQNYIRVPILVDADSRSSFSIKHYSTDDVFKIAFAGQISIRKEGLGVFYDALGELKKQFENFEFHLFGYFMKNEKKSLQKIALNNNIEENLVFHGNIEQATLQKHFENMHLLVLPRPETLQTIYGFSTKLSEYLLSGTPVLLTNVSDNSKYIQDGINGYLINNPDSKLFSKKLMEIISGYSVNCNIIAKNAFTTAKQKFHYSNHANALMNFLSK